MIDEGLEPQKCYDDWMEIRDGLRYDPDITHIRGVRNGYNKNSFCEEIVEANKRLKRKLAIRKAMLQQKQNDEKKTIKEFKAFEKAVAKKEAEDAEEVGSKVKGKLKRKVKSKSKGKLKRKVKSKTKGKSETKSKSK